MTSVCYAGRLSQFASQWSLITCDRAILSWIDGYKIKFNGPVYQSAEPCQTSYSSLEKSFFTESIRNLLTIGAISECEPCNGQFISRVFLVPKPNGKMRFILNLKELNKFIPTQHFKLEDLRTALKLISPDCLMATLDLKDAYFLINVHPESRKYLRFRLDGKLYEFNVLPFGLCTAPYIFTKLLKPVIKLLRSCGFLSSIYLDDLLLIGDTYAECENNLETSEALLKNLGFIINEDKSIRLPSNSCKYLGFIIDTRRWEVRLPTEKRSRIKAELDKIKRLDRCKIRRFAQFIGLLISACPAIEYGWLYTKQLERLKFLNLQGHENYDLYMNIPESILPDINWWISAIDKSVHRIKDDNFVCEIFSDASTTGWGGACGGETASGRWSQTESTLHINCLELLAAFFVLKIFANNYYNCQILLRVDNTTAVSYINRKGGIQYPHLTKVTKDLWQWCEARKIFVVASYIRSSENVIADKESRRSHPDTEWELSAPGYRKLTDTYGIPEVDLFANRINKKCDTYVSWHRDPDAFAFDAFTLDWAKFFFYAFPPVSVILKALRKIISDKAEGILVVPNWSSQPWYPLYMRLLVSNLTQLHPKDVIISNYSNRSIQESTILVAGVLSGQRYCSDASHRQP